MNSKNNLKLNGSGCKDLTAYDAIKKVSNEKKKERNEEIKQAIKLIKNLLKKFDMKPVNRIYIKDLKTGKVYK